MKMPKPPIVFFDFDNTITSIDVLGAIIERFSINRDWEVLEDAWRAGKIGSRECLEGQLQSVRITSEELIQFVQNVRLDPFFPRLLEILNQKQISSMIVSDSFSFIIRAVLSHHQISYEPIFSNELKFEKDRLIPSFPYSSPNCKRCAHCKKIHLLKNADKTRIYIGDGMSDVCPSMEADIVFAKEGLARYLKAAQKPFIAINSLEEVCHFFETTANLATLQKA